MNRIYGNIAVAIAMSVNFWLPSVLFGEERLVPSILLGIIFAAPFYAIGYWFYKKK